MSSEKSRQATRPTRGTRFRLTRSSNASDGSRSGSNSVELRMPGVDVRALPIPVRVIVDSGVVVTIGSVITASKIDKYGVGA